MIDTAERRRSAAGIPFFVLGPGVTPNAALDMEWRQEAGWGYNGIVPAGGTPSSGADDLGWLQIIHRRRWQPPPRVYG